MAAVPVSPCTEDNAPRTVVSASVVTVDMLVAASRQAWAWPAIASSSASGQRTPACAAIPASSGGSSIPTATPAASGPAARTRAAPCWSSPSYVAAVAVNRVPTEPSLPGSAPSWVSVVSAGPACVAPKLCPTASEPQHGPASASASASVEWIDATRPASGSSCPPCVASAAVSTSYPSLIASHPRHASS